MAEQRTVAEIATAMVDLLAIIGGMTNGAAGGFIQGRAESYRRELKRAAPDPALTAALDKIAELQALSDERAAMIVAGESERGHLLQAIAVLEERLGERDDEPQPEPAAEPAVFSFAKDSAVEVVPVADAVDDGEPAASQIPTKSGAAGHSVKSVQARRFRLIGVSDGVDTGYVDEGTAGELANRNHIGPSTIYKLAGNGKVGMRFRVEEVA